MTGQASDQLDAAIAKVETEPLVGLAEFSVALMRDPNRVAILAVPTDITELELLNLISNVLTLGDQLRARRQTSGLVVARALPPT